jgi:iron complex transport system ATP-binding protein
MIAAKGVTIRAGRRVLLDNVSLDLRPGEVLALVGPNGAGKSTLLRTLSGERRPDAGTVTLAGRSVAALPPLALARCRAVMNQSSALAFPMTAAEVVALGRLPWHGTPQASEDSDAVARALRAAHVGHLAAQPHATLSGGERQRVQLARALAQLDGAAPPAALLLDEPTASLDVRHAALLLRLVRERANKGLPVLTVLHDLNEAAHVADRVAVLSGGRLVACGAPRDVLSPDILERVYGIAFRGKAGVGLVPIFECAG